MKMQYLAMIQTNLDDYPMGLFDTKEGVRALLETISMEYLKQIEGDVFRRDNSSIVCGSIVTFEGARPVRFETVEVPQLTDVRGD